MGLRRERLIWWLTVVMATVAFLVVRDSNMARRVPLGLACAVVAIIAVAAAARATVRHRRSRRSADRQAFT
jgi:hypothetical protein